MRLEGPIQGFSPLYLQLCYCLSTAGAPHVRVSIAQELNQELYVNVRNGRGRAWAVRISLYEGRPLLQDLVREDRRREGGLSLGYLIAD